MSTGSTGSIISNKWQLALLIGAPVAIGVGYYVYKQSSSAADVDPTGKPKRKTLEEAKSISLDGTEQEKNVEKLKKKAELDGEKLTPLKEAQSYKDEGNVCYRKGKFDEAIQFYTKAIEKCPAENKIDLAIFYQNRAAAYQMLSRWSKVVEDCGKSIESNLVYGKAYFRRAKAFEATGNILDALDDITAACILDKFQNQSMIMYADTVLKLTGAADAANEFKTRTPVLPSKSFLKVFFSSFIEDPLKLDEEVKSSEELRGFLKAKKAWQSEDYEAIVPACSEELAFSESESQYKFEALLFRGTLNLLMGLFNKAKEDLDAIIENEESNVDFRINALIKRASISVHTENKAGCMDDFNAAGKLNPKNPDVYFQRAQVLILLDQNEDALKDLDQAVKLAPNHASAFIQKCYTEYRLAIVAQDNMRLFSVMHDMKNAAEKFPKSHDVFSVMAQILAEQGQFEQADELFRKAIAVAPDNATSYVHRAVMQLQWTGKIDAAVELLEKSIATDKKCGLAYETLGTLEVQRANLERALELFTLAIKFAKNINEMTHLCALKNAAQAQINITQRLGIDTRLMFAASQQ